MFAQSQLFKTPASKESEAFPEIVRRGYERARLNQSKFARVISNLKEEIPEDSCICLCGSNSRLEAVKDSDFDYAMISNDYRSSSASSSNGKNHLNMICEINNALAKSSLRPCESFSCHRNLSDLVSTENIFSRYSILTLVDSTFAAGNPESYEAALRIIKSRLGGYAIGISAETQAMRALAWYVQREGWIDQLHVGTSVNRFSRLIQLFVTILSINQFGIDSTRTTKTTWIRIERMEPYLPQETTACLRRLWLRALELKEKRERKPTLKESGFIGTSSLLEIWKQLLSISQNPF